MFVFFFVVTQQLPLSSRRCLDWRNLCFLFFLLFMGHVLENIKGNFIRYTEETGKDSFVKGRVSHLSKVIQG